MEGHLEGMLDRDQRTAKLRISVKSNILISVDRCGKICSAATPATTLQQKQLPVVSPVRIQGTLSHFRGRSRRFLWHTKYFWTKLKQVLIVGVYLTLIATFPRSSIAAPAARKMANEPMKWVNPCGVDDVTNGSSENLETLLIQTDIALTNARKELPLFDELKGMLESQQFPWLPEVPKKLGETVTESHLQSLEQNDALQKFDYNLQVFAVALEQSKWDNSDDKNELFNIFRKSEEFVRLLLCEIRSTLPGDIVSTLKVVERSVMPDEYRTKEKSHIKPRNYIIFRDYVNMLEYILEALRYFKEQQCK